jgi:ATP/maltotriose-dependent transcriptional regulator MalT
VASRPRQNSLSSASVGGVPAAVRMTERRVVGLAADGLSNRQIAQHLFITQPTVETHLRHAFQKLGIASRADLPAQLAGEPPVPAGLPG